MKNLIVSQGGLITAKFNEITNCVISTYSSVVKNFKAIETAKKHNIPLVLPEWILNSSLNIEEYLIKDKAHSKNEEATMLKSNGLKEEKSKTRQCS